ncbi:MAG TPA: GNAT family N-acetyltransferase [Thermoleophilaceae bacterium]|nr:GNAT family N-acetyltransferase [Thermoleophilaceae bacterium]
MPTFPLADGSEVRIRPIRPDDKQLLSDGLAHLSPETVYRRFLSPKPSFTRGELRYLTEVDGCDHFALVATLPGPERIVGVARMVRLAGDPRSAEVAVVVADSLQGQGLGRELATRIADEARARGIGRFQATFLSSNVPARRLMERIAERVAAGPPQGATVELTADLVRAA